MVGFREHHQQLAVTSTPIIACRHCLQAPQVCGCEDALEEFGEFQAARHQYS